MKDSSFRNEKELSKDSGWELEHLQLPLVPDAFAPVDGPVTPPPPPNSRNTSC